MTNCDREFVELVYRISRKLLEDLLEAYHRTPYTVSSKPYVERALRLVRALTETAYEKLRSCSRGERLRSV